MTSQPPPQPLRQLAVHFAEIAQTLAASCLAPDQPPTARLVRLAAATVPAADAVSLTLLASGRPPQILAATSDVARAAIQLQSQLGEGPILQAPRGNDLVLIEDLAADRRWPQFGTLLSEHTNLRSILAVRLAPDDRVRAALTFYATRPNAFTDLDSSLAVILGSFTSVSLTALTEQARASNLQTALDSNRQIGVAIGILMTRGLITREQAFDQLRTASQHLHRKLRDIAEDVIDTGELPHD